jgi:hypothetical protein
MALTLPRKVSAKAICDLPASEASVLSGLALAVTRGAETVAAVAAPSTISFAGVEVSPVGPPNFGMPSVPGRFPKSVRRRGRERRRTDVAISESGSLRGAMSRARGECCSRPEMGRTGRRCPGCDLVELTVSEQVGLDDTNTSSSTTGEHRRPDPRRSTRDHQYPSGEEAEGRGRGSRAAPADRAVRPARCRGCPARRGEQGDRSFPCIAGRPPQPSARRTCVLSPRRC